MRPKYKAIILSFILIFLIFSPTNPETPISPVLQNHDANYEENLNENLNKIIIEVNGSQLKPLLNVYTMIPRLAVYNGSQWIELKLELVPYEFREEYAFGVEKQIVPSFDTFVRNTTKFRFFLPSFKTYESDDWWDTALRQSLNMRFKIEIPDYSFIGYFYFANLTSYTDFLNSEHRIAIPDPRPQEPLLDKYYLEPPSPFILVKNFRINVGQVEIKPLKIIPNGGGGDPPPPKPAYPNTRYYSVAFWNEPFKVNDNKTTNVLTPYRTKTATLRIEGAASADTNINARIIISINGEKAVDIYAITKKFNEFHDVSQYFPYNETSEMLTPLSLAIPEGNPAIAWKFNVTFYFGYEAESEKFVKNATIDFLNIYTFVDNYSPSFYGLSPPNGLFLKLVEIKLPDMIIPVKVPFAGLGFYFNVVKNPNPPPDCKINPEKQQAYVKIYVNNYLRWSGVVNSSSNKVFMDAVVPAFFDYMTSLMYNTTVKVSIELTLLTDWIYFPPNTKGCAYWRVMFGAASSFRPEPWPDNSLKWSVFSPSENMGGPHFIGKGMSLAWINENHFFSKHNLKNEPIAFVNIYPVIYGETTPQIAPNPSFYNNIYMVAVNKTGWVNKFTSVKIEFYAGTTFLDRGCSLYISHNGKEYPETKKALETAQEWIGRGFEISSWFFGEASAIVAYFLNVMIDNFIEFLKRNLVYTVTIDCRNDGAKVTVNTGLITTKPTVFRLELYYYSFHRPPSGHHEGNVIVHYVIEHSDNYHTHLLNGGFAYSEIDYIT